MSTLTQKIADTQRGPGKASAGKAAVNLGRAAAFATVEIIAATQLDGWLPWALGAMAAYTIAVVLIALFGLLAIAAESIRAEARR